MSRRTRPQVTSTATDRRPITAAPGWELGHRADELGQGGLPVRLGERQVPFRIPVVAEDVRGVASRTRITPMAASSP